MKKIKNFKQKAIAGVLAVAMLLAFAGCSSDKGGDSQKSVSDIMKTAQENLKDVESISYDMTMEMAMSSEDGEFALNVKGTADQMVDPMKINMDMTMGMDELGEIETKMYIVEEADGSLVTYTGVTGVDGELSWVKQTVLDEYAVAQYNMTDSFELYMESAENFEAKGSETVAGKKATRYDGTISEEAMSKVMKNSGAFEQFGATGMTEEDINTMVSELGKMPISIWISDDDTIPVKYEMDMTEVMKNLMQSMMEGVEDTETANFSFDKMLISVTVNGYDTVEDFEIPAEALSATEIAA